MKEKAGHAGIDNYHGSYVNGNLQYEPERVEISFTIG